MPDPVKIFEKEILALETKFYNDIAKILGRLEGASTTAIIQALQQFDFFQHLQDIGYTSSVAKINAEMLRATRKIGKEAASRGINPIKGGTVQDLTTLAQVETDILLGHAEQFATRLKTGLFEGIIGGRPFNQIVAELRETIPLQTHQLNVAVNDGIRSYESLARAKAFEGEDVLWIYSGPFDNVTRDVCRDTLSNPLNSTGFTEEQVNDTATPFGSRGGFNCRHDWLIFETEAATEIREETRVGRESVRNA